MSADVAGAAIDRPDEAIVSWLRAEIGQVLQCAAPGPDEDFFDCGGDSMAALALFTAIETQFGCALPLSLIYDVTTPAALACCVSAARRTDGAPAAPASNVVPVRTGTAAGAVVMIHGIGGHVFDLCRLGGVLDTERDVVAIRAFGLEQGETPLDRIDTMAATYEAMIAERWPGQTIDLIGYSFGGLVALEIARRRQTRGAAVGGLVLLDSYGHPATWPRAQALDVRWRRARNQARTLWQAPWSERLTYVRARLGMKSGAAAPRGGWLAAPAGAPAEIGAVFAAAEGALEAYRPASFDHPVGFVKPRQSAIFLPTNPEAVWRGLLPQMTIEHVPGSHVSMLESHVWETAGVISRVIGRGVAR